MVCDDSGTVTDLRFLLLEIAGGALLLALLVVGVVLLVRRRTPPRPPVTRVWVSAAGDVVQRRP